MRVLLDTNILVSGIFFSGPPYLILEAWRNRKLDLVISSDIYQEYEDIIRDIHDYHSDIDIDRFLGLILLSAEMCYPDKLHHPITRDPKDDKFIACAVTGNVQVIVSGDKHLLDVSGYGGIQILSPRQFVEKYIN